MDILPTMTQHNIEYNGQHISFTLHIKKIRNIYIRIYPDKKIIVTAPPFTAFHTVEKLIKKKFTWIINKLGESESKNVLIKNDTILFKGKYIPIQYADNLSQKEIIIYNNIMILNPKWKQKKKYINQFYHIQTDQYIQKHIDSLALKLNVQYNQYKVKKIKKWGFCKPNGELCFNQYLTALPENLAQYIILHELAHLIHFNHSKQFKDLLKKNIPEKHLLEKKLKKYHLHL